jgi:hypothetical protein
MATETVERKYALTRIKAGDYLLPDNDGETVWRVRTYLDGPSMGLVDWERDITLWAIEKWVGRVPVWEADDPLDPDLWEWWESNFKTRREAIDAALSA